MSRPACLLDLRFVFQFTPSGLRCHRTHVAPRWSYGASTRSSKQQRSLSNTPRRTAKARKVKGPPTNIPYQPPSRKLTQPPVGPQRPTYRISQLLFWITGAGFAASVGYVATVFLSEPSEAEARSARSIPQDVSDRYHRTAPTFDQEVEFFESFSGMNRLRRRLCARAKGNVLEVSAGTGRNLEYYDLEVVTTLTLLDQAQEMVDVAKEKAQKVFPGIRSERDSSGLRFVTQSAIDPIECPVGGFDTVVQTMGLCSTGDPVKLLKHMGKLVNQETGIILLLEHGQGRYGWLNRALDRSAAAHADKHGCWWNRDIGDIVEQSGLEVVKMSRHHLGTAWWIELRPAQTKV